MPKKSVREMNKLQRQHYSLSARIFRATLLGAFILGAVALLIGLGLYAYALGTRYIGTAFTLSRDARTVLDKVVDVAPLADEVMRRYHALSDEEREQVGTEKYRARFDDLMEREDYKTVREIFKVFLEDGDVYDLYLAMYDRQTEKIVYFVDPDDGSGDFCHPGDWEPVVWKEAERFLSWNGKGRLYDIDMTAKYGWLGTSGVPIKNAAGEPFAFVLSDVSLNNVLRGMKTFLLQYSLAMLLLVNLVGFFMARYMRKRLVAPINRIAEAAERYVRDKRRGAGTGEHFSRLGITTGDELENLSLVMADMERDLAEFEENLTKVTAEKERVGAELSLAQRIQANMLPNVFPPFPERKDFDIFASMTPAKQVGGDFYDFFLIDEDHVGLVMADVSGKGIPAALFMMASMILLQNHTMAGKSPKEVLETVNAQICANNREEMFVTVWLGILDLKTGVLTAANAGHEFPVVKQPDGDFEIFKDPHGFVIGGMDGMRYKEYELQLKPGAKLFLYTDGVPEASDAKSTLFGPERMLEALRGAQDGSPEEVLGAVDAAVKRFVGDAPQFDDLTMLCIQYNGKTEANAVEITLKATTENIPAVTDFVDAELEKLNCPMKAQMQIDVAIDELFSNIARYAYHPKIGSATVRVEILHDPPAVEITFTDSGKPYDPLAKEDPDTTLSAEERKIGGLGIFLVKKTMDNIRYEYKDGKNILTIRKNL